MIENINWYPGHMKKTRELIEENLKLVDVVIEVIDARIPVSSRNPVIDDILKNKRRAVILNKSDLADECENKKWAAAIDKSGHAVVAMNCVTGSGISKLLKLLGNLQEEKNSGNSRNRPLRMMIAGVPNVGKSSLINRLAGKKSAKTGDRPGITRGKQWIGLDGGMLLLDTPGILWPKFEDRKTGLYLAFCGSIKDEILDRETLALELITVLQDRYPGLLKERYGIGSIDESPINNMEAIALKRGFLLTGKRIDYDRTARTLLDEFRSGRMGRITLETNDGV
jgi:ribosome biogenesis GTPase A